MSYPANVTYPPPPYRVLGTWAGPRMDSEKKICGVWPLGADFNQDNQAYMAVKLSPYSAATITAVDETAAKAIPGVLSILTTTEVAADPVLSKIMVGSYHLLPTDQVRYAGQEVAAVCAEDPYTAVQACEAINITYNQLPYVNTVEAGMASGAPQVWSGTPNLQTASTYTFGNAAAAMTGSGLQVFSGTYTSNDCHNNPVAGMAGTVSARTIGRPEVWESNQGAKSTATGVASFLGLPYSRGWAKASTCDGSYGGKSGGGYYDLALTFSQRLGRPVKFIMTREHDIRNGSRHPRDVFQVQAAVTPSTGQIQALTCTLYNNTGAAKSAGVGTAAGAAPHFYNVYKVPNWTINAYEVWTNYPSPSAYRNPPGPHADFGMHVFFDYIAGQLGLNPATMMQNNNMYSTGDKNQLNGLPFYSIEQPAVMNQALKLSNFMSKWKAAPKSPSGLTGVQYGIGIANTASSLGSTAGADSTAVLLLGDGSLEVSSGGTDIGEGRTEQERLFCAEMMGLPMDDVTIANNDSEFVGDTGGTNGSSQTKASGNCLVLACADAKNQMMAKAATSLGVTGATLANGWQGLTYAMDGSMKIYVTANPSQSVTFAQCAGQPSVIGVGHMVAPTGVTGNVFTTAVAEVNVDCDTGLIAVNTITEVQGVGQVIFLAGLTGQAHQGATAAMGQTLQEFNNCDPATGMILGASHLDDKVPLFTQVPSYNIGLQADQQEQPPLSYNFGAKGCCEPWMGAPIPAIVNAVANATGWWATTLPLTPDVVLKGLGKA